MCEDLKQNNERWIIVYLIYADFVDSQRTDQVNASFLDQLDNLCKDLLTCKIADEAFSVYAALSTVNYTIRTENNSFAPSSSSFLYKLSSGENAKNRIKLISNPSDVVFQDKKDLTDVFNQIIAFEKKTNSRPLKVFLTTWDHGSAFGIFKVNNSRESIKKMYTWDFIIKESPYFFIAEFLKETQCQLNEKKEKIFQRKNKTKIYALSNKVFAIKENEQKFAQEMDSFSIEDAEIFLERETPFLKYTRSNAVVTREITFQNEILSNEELAEAMKKSFGKVDVLMMMNCWMMNLDTLCWFDQVVSYFIAPQTGIDYPVYNYSGILAFIYTQTSRKINLSPEELSIYCIQSIKDKQGKRMAIADLIDSCAVFGVQLGKTNQCNETVVESIVKIINEFVRFLIVKMGEENGREKLKYILKYAAVYCFNFDDKSKLYLIDFLHWIKNIRHAQRIFQIIDDLTLLKIISSIEGIEPGEGLLRKLFLSNGPHIGREWYSGDEGSVLHNLPSGLSIYLPSKEKGDDEKKIIKLFIDVSKNSIKYTNQGFYFKSPDWVKIVNFILEEPLPAQVPVPTDFG